MATDITYIEYYLTLLDRYDLIFTGLPGGSGSACPVSWKTASLVSVAASSSNRIVRMVLTLSCGMYTRTGCSGLCSSRICEERFHG